MKPLLKHSALVVLIGAGFFLSCSKPEVPPTNRFPPPPVIKLLLGELFPELKIGLEADNIKDAVPGIKNKTPQLVFLDILPIHMWRLMDINH